MFHEKKSHSGLTRFRVNDDRMCILEWIIWGMSQKTTTTTTLLVKSELLYLDTKYSWTSLSLSLAFFRQYFQETAISMSKCIPKGIAKLCLPVFPMKNWEELCVSSGYRSRQGESSYWDHCATQDYGHQSIRITHICAQCGQCISSEIPLTTASGMERSVLSALSAAVWCVRLLRLSGAFFMHTAAALSIYEAFSVSLQRLFVFIWVKYYSYNLIIAEYWNILG